MSRNIVQKVAKIKRISSDKNEDVIKCLVKELISWSASSNGVSLGETLSLFNENVNNTIPDYAQPYLLEHIDQFAQSEEAKKIFPSEKCLSNLEIDNRVAICLKNVTKRLKAKGLDSKTIENECFKPFTELKETLKASSKIQEEVNACLLEFFIRNYEELYQETVTKFEKMLKVKDEVIAQFITESKAKDEMIELLKHRLAKHQLGITSRPPKRHRYPTLIIEIAILAVTYAKCSLRGAVKIIEIIQEMVADLNPNRKCKKPPTHITIKEWLSRTGYSIYKKNPKEWLIRQGYYIILDESVSVGSQKLLVILVVPTMLKKTGPLKISDVAIAFMKSAESWEHEQVKEAVNQVIAQYGREPDYCVSDNGANLDTAMKEMGIPRHRDISHTFANHLETVYGECQDFIEFCSACSETRRYFLGKKGYLMCPSARTKARFMNVFIPVFWAYSILDNYFKFNSLERKAFRKIYKFAYLVPELMEIETAFNAVFKVIKNKGLCKETYNLCVRIIQTALFCGTERQREVASLVISYFKEEMEIVNKRTQKLSESGVEDNEVVDELSSDVIESMFGSMKMIMPESKFFGLTEHCLTLNNYTAIEKPSDIHNLDIYNRFSDTRGVEVRIWKKGGNIAPSLLSKRQEKLDTERPKIEYVA